MEVSIAREYADSQNGRIVDRKREKAGDDIESRHRHSLDSRLDHSLRETSDSCRTAEITMSIATEAKAVFKL